MIEPVSANNPTPGSLLRHKRQHIGWTVDEIANALCLSPELIRALEADDFENMGGSTFILGYLRAYARLVGVDIEDAIIGHRDEIPEYVPDPEHIPNASRREQGKRFSSRRSVLAAAALVVLAGITAAVVFWPDRIAEDTRVEEGLTAELPGETSGFGVEAPSEPPQPPDRLSRTEALGTALVRQAIERGDTLPVNLTLADIPLPESGSASAPVQPASPDDAKRHLVLLFDEGSWADVRDAAGKRLLSQTVAEGSSVDLVGEPPFTVFLGNAGGVRVKYKGRIQTYSQTEKGLFARFTVGQEQ